MSDLLVLIEWFFFLQGNIFTESKKQVLGSNLTSGNAEYHTELSLADEIT